MYVQSYICNTYRLALCLSEVLIEEIFENSID